MKDKQYRNMNEVKEDAENALAKSEPVVTQEDNPMFNDMKKLAGELNSSAVAIDRYMEKWHGQFEPGGLHSLRIALREQREKLSYM